MRIWYMVNGLILEHKLNGMPFLVMIFLLLENRILMRE